MPTISYNCHKTGKPMKKFLTDAQAKMASNEWIAHKPVRIPGVGRIPSRDVRGLDYDTAKSAMGIKPNEVFVWEQTLELLEEGRMDYDGGNYKFKKQKSSYKMMKAVSSNGETQYYTVPEREYLEKKNKIPEYADKVSTYIWIEGSTGHLIWKKI